MALPRIFHCPMQEKHKVSVTHFDLLLQSEKCRLCSCFVIDPPRKTPAFRHGDIRGVPFLGLGHRG